MNNLFTSSPAQQPPPPSPNPYRAHLATREAAFQSALQNNTIDRFLYPWDALPALILVLAVLFIPGRRRSRLYARLAFALILALCVSTTRRCRSIGMTGGYGIGLMSAWGVLWTAVLLLCNDPKTKFRRIERRDVRVGMTQGRIQGKRRAGEQEGYANGVMTVSSAKEVMSASRRSLKNRRVWGVSGTSSEPASDDGDAKGSTPPHQLVWQGFPKSLGHRLDWTIDLCTSFRGPGWNWRISTLPPVDLPPSFVPSDLSASRLAQIQLATTPPSTLRALNRKAALDMIIYYLLVDIMKSTMMSDPYFWGAAALSSALPYDPPYINASPIAITTLRLLISMSSVILALSLIFSLSPLFFSLLLPNLAPNLTKSPMTEPLLNPPYWGPFVSSVLDHGLPGFWGRWWHQMFRFGYQEPGRVLIEQTLRWDPRTQKATVVQVVVAFVISGSLHACASYSAFADSRPLAGPFAFFAMQGVGVLGQSLFAKWFANTVFDVKTRAPRWARRVLNITSVAVWFYWTGPLLADDFARCGVWLFEPLPVSLVRGLGFGPIGEGWWCWGGRWAGWWSGDQGDPIWRKGLAIY